MLHLAAAERRQLQQRIDGLMDGVAVNMGGKAVTEWIGKLTKTRSKL